MVERWMDGATNEERGRMRDSVTGRQTWAGRGLVACLLLAMVCVLAPVVVHGQDKDHDDDHDAESAAQPHDRVGIFTTLVVTPGQPAEDVACMFCTVRVDGDVRGDVAVMFGTVSVGKGRTVAGDVAMLFSALNVEEGARINGDLATAFSTANIALGAHVRGDRAMLASGLGAAVLFGPILILIGLVWLIVWGLRRTLLY